MGNSGSENSSAADRIDPELEREIEQVAEIYLEALLRGSPLKKEDLLAAHPDIASRLRRRLTLVDLLYAASRPGWTEEDSSEPNPSSSAPFQRILQEGESLGRFELIELLGGGAFGIVYKAYDPQLKRTVALKVPRAAFTSASQAKRFMREARSAAGLKHPGIIQVYQTAEEEGLPYIVSEFVEGVTLAERLRQGPVGFRTAALLVQQLAEALLYAHARGVIHRDIKPGNIIVDKEGNPHLGDFGLARCEEDEGQVTIDGQIIGTPAYMAPEQAAGEQEAVGPHSDVYSLGVILYEMICGRRPFTYRKGGLIHQGLLFEPPPPRSLNPNIPKDLETICSKAMARKPSERYTAEELALDLKRYLAGEPIRARPIGPAVRLYRWCRRNPLVATLLVALALSLAGGAAAAAVAALRASRARDLARARLSHMSVASGRALAEAGDFAGALPFFVQSLELEQGRSVHERAARLRVQAARERCAKPVHLTFLKEKPLLGAFSSDKAFFFVLTAHAASVFDLHSRKKIFALQGESFVSATFNRTGDLFAAATRSGCVWIRKVKSDSPAVRTFNCGARVRRISFAPRANLLLVEKAGGACSVWDVSTGRLRAKIRQQPGHCPAAFGPDGRLLATGGNGGVVRLWRLRAGDNGVLPVAAPLRFGSPVGRIAFSPDGRFLLAVSLAGAKIRVWHLESRKLLFESDKFVPGRKVYFSFSPQGGFLALGYGPELEVHFLDPTSPYLVRRRTSFALSGLAFSPDGSRLAYASLNGTIAVEEIGGENPSPYLLRHPEAALGVSFDSESRRILAWYADNAVRIWDLAGTMQPVLVIPSGVSVAGIGFFSGRGCLAAFDTEGSTILWNFKKKSLSSLRIPFERFGKGGPVVRGPQGVSALLSRRKISLWNALSGRILNEVTFQAPPKDCAFDKHGSTLAVLTADGEVHIAAPAEGKVIRTITCGPSVAKIALSRDGRLLGVISLSGRLAVWETDSGRLLHDARRYLDAHSRAKRVFLKLTSQGIPPQIEFCWEGRRVLTTNGRKTAWLRESSTGRLIATLEHLGEISAVALSPDGRRIATCSADGTARVWDARTGRSSGPSMDNLGLITACAFSACGSYLATGEKRGVVRLWLIATGQEIAPLFKCSNTPTQLAFSSDGKRLGAFDVSGTLYVIELEPVLHTLEKEAQYARALSGIRLDENSGVVRLRRAEFQEAWRTLAEDMPEELRSSKAEEVAWHLNALSEKESAGDWASSLSELDQLCRLQPDYPWHYVRRAECLGRLGRIEQCAENYATAIKLGWPGIEARCLYFLCLLAAGRRPDPALLRDILLNKRAKAAGPRDAVKIVWAAGAAPLDPPAASLLVKLARNALESFPKPTAFRAAWAVALLRAGSFARAREEFLSVLRRGITGGLRRLVQLYLTVACSKSGDLSGALKAYFSSIFEPPGSATDSLEKPLRVPSWLSKRVLCILRREAAEALRRGLQRAGTPPQGAPETGR